MTLASFTDRSFGALAQYGATDMVAAMRYLNALGEVSLECDPPDRRAVIRDNADKLVELAAEGLNGFSLARVHERADELHRALDAPAFKRRLRDGTTWLSGTA